MDDAILIEGITPARPRPKKKRPSKITPTPTSSTARRYKPKESQAIKAAAAFYEHILPEATPLEANFRHGHWRARRTRIRDMLQRSGVGVHALNRWDACGGQCIVQYSPSLKKWRLAANYCKSRHCEPCMRAKANKIARNLRDRLLEQRAQAKTRHHVQHRFITLTLRHNDSPLADQIRRLMTSFKKLRANPVWKKTQTGGAAMLEIKWSGKHWHPHLHVISQGEFLSRESLSHAWHQATGDSFITDIRALSNVDDACHYVSKYITKGTSSNVWENDDTAAEWISAARGVRTCNTFGTWRGFKLTAYTPEANDWIPHGTLESLIVRAHQGDLAAQAIYLELRPPGDTDQLDKNQHQVE